MNSNKSSAPSRTPPPTAVTATGKLSTRGSPPEALLALLAFLGSTGTLSPQQLEVGWLRGAEYCEDLELE